MVIRPVNRQNHVLAALVGRTRSHDREAGRWPTAVLRSDDDDWVPG
jgi:hypothetical protein